MWKFSASNASQGNANMYITIFLYENKENIDGLELCYKIDKPVNKEGSFFVLQIQGLYFVLAQIQILLGRFLGPQLKG